VRFIAFPVQLGAKRPGSVTVHVAEQLPHHALKSVDIFSCGSDMLEVRDDFPPDPTKCSLVLSGIAAPTHWHILSVYMNPETGPLGPF
jgi:hypothetical protein